MEKDKFIKTINSKGLHNSIISIYYNIGRALPFTAQRFPDGRVSEWYKSQYVEVVRVEPGGRGGKYGKAFGFYYRNGERADSTDDGTECWCKKDDVEPQEIPCAACGSWGLIDIKGEQTAEPTKVYGLKDIIDFGKHKGQTLEEVIHNDFNWVKWAINNSEHFFCDLDEVGEEYRKSIKFLGPDDILPFGKYIGKTVKAMYDENPKYLIWFEQNADNYRIDFDKLIKK